MNANDRAITGLVMLAHAMVHTYELSLPVLVLVWLDVFETNTAVLGVVVTVGYGLFGLGALPSGVVVDRIGSHRLIVACLAGMSGSFLLLALAPTIPVIALALLLWGAAASVYHPSGLSLISKGVQERGSAFAYHGMAGNAGIAFGPLATLLAVEVLPWRVVTALLAIPAAVGTLFALRVEIDETAAVAAANGGEEGESGATAGEIRSLGDFVRGSRELFVGAFVAIFAIVICSGLYYRGVLTFLPDILEDFALFEPVTVAGNEFEPDRYVYVAILTVGIAGQYAGGKLTDRIRPEVGIVGGMAVLATLAAAFLPASRLGIGPFLAVSALLGVFLFAVQPMYQAAVADLTPSGRRGLSYGYTYLAVFGVGSLGGTVAGAILAYGTAGALFAVLAGIATTAALLAGGLAVRTRA